MTQYPIEKDPQSGWLSPPDLSQGAYADATPPAPGKATPSTEYYTRPQDGLEQYTPPPGPPPDYVCAQGEARSGYHDEKSLHIPQEDVPPPAPSANSQSYAPHGAPIADAGHSSSSSGQDGHGLSLAAFFGNKGSPLMWSRPPPAGLPYATFPPLCLISNGKDLSKGFPELPPPCQLSPHPFATHDVTEEDWKRFLADVKKAGGLTARQRIRSSVLPMVMGMGIFGFMMTNALEGRMKFQNRGAAGDLVDHWNHYFFGPRRMEVVLCQASERLSGREGAAPVGDPHQERMAYGLRRRDDSLSDGDSSEYERHHGHGHNYQGGVSGRGGRRGRGGGRGKANREMQDWKARGGDQQPYQLYVTAAN